jgi:CBS-domain-containing membrane protein
MNQVAQNTQSVATTHSGANAVPEAAWSPLAGGLLVLVPGLLGLATGNVWLFPSLGPTAYLQAATPQHGSARPYNVVGGHALGAIAAIIAVLLLGANHEPSVFEAHHLFLMRVLASALAIALLLLAETLTKITHPPAAATTLLITLGGFKPTLHDMASLATGVLIIAILGELMRRARLAQPGQK